VDVTGSVTADGLTVSASLASADLAYLNNTNATQSDVLRLNTAGVGVGTNILDVQSGDTTRFLVRGDGNVGIGTVSPAQLLHVNSTGNVAAAQIQGASHTAKVSTDGAGAIFGTTTNGYMLLTTNAAERMRITSGGSVGIGTSASSYPLEVHGSSGQIIYAQADSGDGYVRVDSSNAGSEAIFWARATTTGYSTLQFGDPDDSDVGWIKYQHSNNSMAFRTNGIEHMRIDNVGNLHVGKTVTGIATAGLSLRGDVNVAQFTRDGGDPLNLNRLTSDGDIVGFYKDGTIVGSIGNSGTQLTIDSSSNLVLEANSGASNVITRGRLRPLVDNTDDIGSADRRFKDLYLSGGVYVGGTGSANYLDDYEEGTWTPAFNLVTVTHTAQYGRYVKIGRLVYCKARIEVSSIDNLDGSGIQITVPFTANSGTAQGGAATTFAYDSQNSTLMDGSHADVHGAYVTGTTFAVTNDSGGNMTYSQLTQTSGIFQFAFTFEATT